MKTAAISTSFEVVGGVWIAPLKDYRGKRLMDIVLAIALLTISLPIIVILWCLVRFDGGPGFFGHRRIGKDGRSFRCWKLRTMVLNADTHLNRYLAQNASAAREWLATRKLDCDPRITRLGGLMRKFHLDELPQLWNVLVGDMSLVGPRPIVLEELQKYGVDAPYYLACRPGLTGPWQISMPTGSQPYLERIRLDVGYAKGKSLIRDIAILGRTAVVVFLGRGK